MSTAQSGVRTAATRRVTPIRLAVVNDYEIVTVGLAALLAPHGDQVTVQECVGTTPRRGSVDVVLFDAFAAPDPTRRLLELIAATGAPVIVFSWLEAPNQIDAALALGAAGFVPKSAPAEEILAAVQSAHLRRRVAAQRTAGSATHQAWPGREVGLSGRESEVLAYIAQGLSNQDIAERCYLSINSVKTYIRSAYQKIGVTSRSRAVIWAVQHGFLAK